MSKRVCYIALPHYGNFAAPTVQALLTATFKLSPFDVQVQFECASLLACCFNRLWAECLNRRAGEAPERRPDFFVMLHSDVGPDPGWLDTLLEEMDRTGADVLSAVVPIKDLRGLTSTGVMDPATRQVRRFTLREVHGFPVTFDAAGAGHAGEALMVNTGCWVCRLDRPWVGEFPGFTILDGLVNVGDKKGVAVLSEDWHASRWWHEHGVKVFATRKVRVCHQGGANYWNDSAWGEWATDRGDGVLAPPGEAAPKARPFWPSKEFPGVNGWLSDDEGRALARLAAGKDVLEIGSYEGLSTLWLARTAASVAAVDTFDGRGVAGHERHDTLAAFRRNLAAHGVDDKVTVWRGQSGAESAEFRRSGDHFDLCFIDGAHDEQSVWADACACLEVLSPGGLLAFHDYGAEAGVTATVRRLQAEGAKLVEAVGSLAVIRPAAHQCGRAEEMAAAGGA